MKLEDYLNDIFTIDRPKPAPKVRQYLVTWPCGSTWEFDRRDLDVPEFRNGDQTGLTHCYDSIKEAISNLQSIGCKVERTS
jgi:hypothetical protein